MARQLIKELGVDVAAMEGTGIRGRITREDVLRHVGKTEGPIGDLLVGGSSAPFGMAGDQPANALAGWTTVEADVTGLVQARARHRETFVRQAGVPLTYGVLFARSVAGALRHHPRLAGREGGTSMGVVTPAAGAPMVPALRDIHLLSLPGIAVSLDRQARAARDGTLSVEDSEVAAFTLHNTGALGSVVSMPGLQAGQTAVMTTEAIVDRPVAVGGGAVEVRSMMNLCLSFDHRVVTTSEAAAFLKEVRERLEAVGPDSPLE